MGFLWPSMRSEIKQETRSPVFWLLGVLGIALSLSGYYFSTNVWEHLHRSHTSDVLPLFSLGLAVWAVAVAGRERRERVSELVDCTPAVSWGMVFGRWLGVGILALGLSGTSVLVSLARVVAGGGVLDLVSAVKWFALVEGPVALFWATVGLVAGSLIQNGLIAVTAVLAVWAGFTALETPMINATRSLPGPLGEMVDLTGVQYASTSSAVYGLLPVYRFALNRAGVLAFTGLVLFAGALLFKRSREARPHLVPVVAALVCLATVAGAWFGLKAQDKTISQALAAGEDLRQKAVQSDLVPWSAQVSPGQRLTAYDITVTLEPSRHRMSALATVNVENSGPSPLEHVVFSLNPVFKVDRLTVGGDGYPATAGSPNWRTNGLWYDVALPGPLEAGRSLQMAISYSGTVYQWAFRWGDRDPELTEFIAPQGVFLPGFFGWYPLPGLRVMGSVAAPGNSWETPSGASGPALFRVTVGRAPGTAVLNLEPESNGSWVGRVRAANLLAGRWQVAEGSGVRFWYTGGHDQITRSILDDTGRIRQRLEQLLPALPVPKISLVTLPSWGYGDLDTVGSGMVRINDAVVAQADRPERASWDRMSFAEGMISNWLPRQASFPEDRPVTGASGASGAAGAAGAADAATDVPSDRDQALGIYAYLWSDLRVNVFKVPPSFDDEAGLRREAEKKGAARSALAAGGARPWERQWIWPNWSTASNRVWLQLDDARRSGGDIAVGQELMHLPVLGR